MRVKIFNRIIILLCMILLLSGCRQKTNTFPQIEDLSLFGSSVKEAGKLLGINLLDISPTISENSEQLEVYQLPGTWMIGEGEAEVSLHFLTTSTPKGNPMGLEMVTMEFSSFKCGTRINIKRCAEFFSELFDGQIFNIKLLVFILEKIHEESFKCGQFLLCFLRALRLFFFRKI